MATKDLRAWRLRRWRKDPRCAYCRVLTILWTPPPKGTPANDPRQRMPGNAATVDHLRDQWDPTRKEPIVPGQVRRVLACANCNHARGAYREALQPIEELHRRAKRHGLAATGAMTGKTDQTTGGNGA